MSLREEIDCKYYYTIEDVYGDLHSVIDTDEMPEIINKVLDAAVEAVEKAIDKDVVFGQQERAVSAINKLRGES